MAMTAVRRLQRHMAPLQQRARWMGSSALATSSSKSRSGSCKVADRTLRLTVIDEDGSRHAVQGLTGQTVLKTLVNSRLVHPQMHPLEDITACSGQCEVTVANEWLQRLPPRSQAELDVLKAANGGGQVDRHARLGCQVVLTPELEGMVVAIADEKPWNTL